VVNFFSEKLVKFDATRCQILTLKCTKFDFRWGVYSVPPNLLAVFKGTILRGWRRKGRKGGRKRDRRGGEGCGGERSEREGPGAQIFLPRTAPDHDCHPIQHRQMVKVTWHKAVSPSSTDRYENCICPVVPINTSSNTLAQTSLPQNGISIGSSVFAGLSNVPNTKTNHGRCDRRSNRPHLCNALDEA